MRGIQDGIYQRMKKTMYKEFRGTSKKINAEMKIWFEDNKPVVFKQVIQSGTFNDGREMKASIIVHVWYNENI